MKMLRLDNFQKLYLKPFLLFVLGIYIYIFILGHFMRISFVSLSAFIPTNITLNEEVTLSHIEIACVHPKLALWHPAINSFFKQSPPLKCIREENWVYVRNGTLFISDNAILNHGNIHCLYIPKVRSGDFVVNNRTDSTLITESGFALTSDFFEIQCRGDDGAKYRNVHSGIMLNETIHRRASSIELPNDALGLNILIIAIEGTSHLTWMRTLPKTHDYYVNTLGGLVLEGYNIVGDGTPQALLPILTGMTEDELPYAIRGKRTAKPVDGHPWIWKKVQEIGYVTQFGEDQPQVGAFNYRMKGFSAQPTDHYMRPFYIEANKNTYKLQQYCLGSISKHQNMLNWIKDFYEMYKTKRKFSFMFHGEYSHGKSNQGSWADNGMKDFLVNMNKIGYLNNTLLMLMSDHGARFQSIRRTLQGKLEERLPYFSFRFPPEFHQKYPEIVKNFKTNVHRLTTPFDIHATLLDIISYNGGGVANLGSRGISLFKEIPPERNCIHANIEPHWCACLKWETLNTTDSSVQEAASSLINQINVFTSNNREQCMELSVKSVSSAGKYAPNANLLMFKQSFRRKQFTDKMTASEVLYQIQVYVTPGHGFFEATVKHMVNENLFVINAKEISRINKYGLHPHCVMHELPHLRPYCYCKHQLT